jgi:hypothetical protein
VVGTPSVMSDAVLVRTQWLGPRCDVCRRDNVKKVLVGNESYIKISVAAGDCCVVKSPS